MKDHKQREYYRLKYPQSYRPCLLVDIENYEIEDISEHGMKFKIDSDQDFLLNENIMASIAFPDGKEFDLSGHIIRIENDYASIELDTILPLSLIRSEYIYISDNYENFLNS